MPQPDKLTQEQKDRISQIDFFKLRSDMIYLKSLSSNLFTEKEHGAINDFIETSFGFHKDINKNS